MDIKELWLGPNSLCPLENNLFIFHTSVLVSMSLLIMCLTESRLDTHLLPHSSGGCTPEWRCQQVFPSVVHDGRVWSGFSAWVLPHCPFSIYIHMTLPLSQLYQRSHPRLGLRLRIPIKFHSSSRTMYTRVRISTYLS